MNKSDYPFCKSCGLFSLCMGNPLDAIKVSNAYLCPICEHVYIAERKYPWSAVCGQFYGVMVRVKRVSICTDANCVRKQNAENEEWYGNYVRDSRVALKKEGANEQGDNE